MNEDIAEAGRLAGPSITIGFRTSITTLFVAILLLVGLTLVYLSFLRVTSITQAAATRFLERVAEHTADRIDAQFKDVRDGLDVLKQIPPIEVAAIADNPGLYATMAAVLRNNEHLYNCYAGYDDGTFVELDMIDRAGPSYRQKLAAPEHAKFRLVVIRRPDRTSANRSATVTILTDDMATISQSTSDADYDPRERPWYRGAFEGRAGVLTDPYVFHATGQPGYTLRSAIPAGRRGVVAGDIMLGEAEALLRRQQPSPSGTVFLFDDDGRVVAHPSMSEVTARSGSEDRVDLPTLADVDKVGVAGAIKAWRRGGGDGQIFRAFDGRTYAAAFRTIATAGSANLRLVVMAPLDEFFSEIERERRTLFLATLGFVAAMVPLVLCIGSLMSRRLRALAEETDRIQRFLPKAGPPIRSVIREIDGLGRSVQTLRSVVQTFSRFVPKRLVQQLVESGSDLALGGARREITVMFTDVVDFTAITERAEPEQVMSFTSRYFAALSGAVMDSGGMVDKFIGDSVMAIWNAPADDPNHVVNACSAALDCLDANLALNRRFETEGWPAYRTRIGLHTGAALVGNVGSEDRMNFTALGANVNLASRLEGLNKIYGTAILVSEAVKEAAGDGFLFRCVDSIRPKGFDQTFEIFELCCRRHGSTETEAFFCRSWNSIYARIMTAPAAEALCSLRGFADCYPEDQIARLQLQKLLRQCAQK
ncbi:adenylate/guanylate cyclase domain-containing protein [Tardiphaga sp. 841_E9_N1_2]|uniref:adenylate/guanylate cyclase domain-containing protein n=1 Tax=Tardiphaga sp. 841_E9_N1_2 TaxID=3240762 RepID=UPI003F279253